MPDLLLQRLNSLVALLVNIYVNFPPHLPVALDY